MRQSGIQMWLSLFCFFLTLFLALVGFNVASRKELWSRYGKVPLHGCTTCSCVFHRGSKTSLLSVCFAWCVRGFLFLHSHDLPSPTGKRGWVKLGGRERVGDVCGPRGGVTAHSLPSFPNPGNLCHVTFLRHRLLKSGTKLLIPFQL